MAAMIADWLTSSGLGALKPVLSALVLPPTPFVVLALAGAGLARARPRTGRALVGLAAVGVWLGCCAGAAQWVEGAWLDEPAALGAAQRAALKTAAEAGESMAIVVLGGGMDRTPSEYSQPDLGNASLARLRYGVWLGRQTGIPVGATGGRGWASSDPAVPPEAARMAEIARTELGSPLRWTENDSRDTHENAVDTLALLRAAGVRHIVVVTHGWHMPRALREFRAAAAAGGPASAPVRLTPAPMGQAYPADSALTRWMPSGAGLLRMTQVLHEVAAGIGDRR